MTKDQHVEFLELAQENLRLKARISVLNAELTKALAALRQVEHKLLELQPEQLQLWKSK